MSDRDPTGIEAKVLTVSDGVVHGTRDEVIPFAHGVALAKRFPRGELVRVEGGHHNDLWSEHLGAITAALRAPDPR